MKRKKRRRRRTVRLLLLLIIAAAALVADSNLRIATDEYSVRSARLPEAFSGFRVVQLSDLHGTAFGSGNDYLISSVEKAEPDIIAVTGDLIDDRAQLEWVRALMPRLVAIAPVYYVSGNHEWPTGVISELFDILEETGVTALRNSYELLSRGGEEIIIAGVEDPNGPADMKNPRELVADIRESEGDKYMLLLVHRNDWLEKYSSLDVDTVLCGHAHGGLVRLPFTDGLIDTRMDWFPTYTSGIYSENGTDMVVSRGMGNTGKTFRVLNNPHIPIVILTK